MPTNEPVSKAPVNEQSAKIPPVKKLSQSDGCLSSTTVASINSLLPDVSKITSVSVNSCNPNTSAPKIEGWSLTPMSSVSFDTLKGTTEYSITKGDNCFSVERKFARYSEQTAQPGLANYAEGWEVGFDGKILGSSLIVTKFDANGKPIVTESSTGPNSGAAACTTVVQDILRRFPEKQFLVDLKLDNGSVVFGIGADKVNQPIQLPEEGYENYTVTMTKK